MHLALNRFDMSKEGTLGLLSLTGTLFQTYFTVEKPWRQNQPFVSCAPPGNYVLIPFHSPKFGKTFALYGGTVGLTKSPRTKCLLHWGNWEKDVLGCIAIGMGHLKDKKMITRSRLATQKVLSALEAEEDMGAKNFLTIREFDDE